MSESPNNDLSNVVKKRKIYTGGIKQPKRGKYVRINDINKRDVTKFDPEQELSGYYRNYQTNPKSFPYVENDEDKMLQMYVYNDGSVDIPDHVIQQKTVGDRNYVFFRQNRKGLPVPIPIFPEMPRPRCGYNYEPYINEETAKVTCRKMSKKRIKDLLKQKTSEMNKQNKKSSKNKSSSKNEIENALEVLRKNFGSEQINELKKKIIQKENNGSEKKKNSSKSKTIVKPIMNNNTSKKVSPTYQVLNNEYIEKHYLDKLLQSFLKKEPENHKDDKENFLNEFYMQNLVPEMRNFIEHLNSKKDENKKIKFDESKIKYVKSDNKGNGYDKEMKLLNLSKIQKSNEEKDKFKKIMKRMFNKASFNLEKFQNTLVNKESVKKSEKKQQKTKQKKSENVVSNNETNEIIIGKRPQTPGRYDDTIPDDIDLGID